MKQQSAQKDFFLLAFIVPGKITRLTGGSIYDKHLADYLSERGVRVDVVSVPDLSYFTGALISPVMALWLALRIAGRGYDLIIEDGWAHPSFLLFNIAFRLVSRSRFVIIAHQLRWIERKRGTRIAARIERAALRSGHLIITVSRFMRGEIASLIGDVPRVVIARPGVRRGRGAEKRRSGGAEEQRSHRDSETSILSPLHPFTPAPPHPYTPVRLLFVGNCVRRKGLHHLIHALSHADCEGLALDIVGDCDFDPRYFEELRREAARLGPGHAVKFHGRVSDEALQTFYARADIFVMPSLYEGFGIVYAEAMQSGLPIVALDAGPLPEIARAGENAVLVPPFPEESLPRALARAICELATDGEMRARFSRRSLEIATELPAWKETCETVYQSLLSLIEPERDFTAL